MLQSLHIHNFALIEDLHISFADGVTILTGETGAGKSILLDAIGMLCGKRASASFVRQGTDAFLVEGAFFFLDKTGAMKQVLEANHIEWEDGQLIISRKFHKSGRGSILVNGTLIPTSVVRTISAFLLDIHGQFDNQLIFDPAYHVTILDSLTPELKQVRQEYDNMYSHWHSLCREAQKLQKDEGEKARLLSILDFQIKEIEGAQLKEKEDEELEEAINKASYSEHIKDTLRTALYAFEGGDRQKGMTEQIDEVHRSLEKASAYEPSFAGLAARVETLSYELEDIHDSVARYADTFTFDENALDRMQSRLASIEKLKRKYGFTISDIMTFLKKAKADFSRLDQSENTLAELEKQIHQESRALRQKAGQLMELRTAADKVFRQKMEDTLFRLGLVNSRIAFHMEPMKDITPEGAAAIELYFSANKGESMQPLAKIASGGEVSRIALALKANGPDSVEGRTMIFDEIDVGISGQTGLQVAAEIRKLSSRGQVLCITHLPQTAASADHHYFIYKKEKDGRTVTQVRALSEEDHIREIARMFAGDDTSPASITAARQLISQVREHKPACSQQ